MSREPVARAADALLSLAAPAMDRRLDRTSGAPLAVGFSGGGDSLALLVASLAWARGAGRPVTALVVDHGLRPESAAWTRDAVAAAKSLGAEAQALAWTGPKPPQGLPAAARQARHRLLASAAREMGARVILLGHTADDLIEAGLMRREGSTVGDPQQWSPSPSWPEGRGVFLLRPLLDVRRAALREILSDAGLDWIEDPANSDPAFARSRARARIGGAEVYPGPQPAAGLEALAKAARVDRFGVIHIERQKVLAASEATAMRLLAAALVCAGGGDRLPRSVSIRRILDRLRGGEGFAATASGSRLEAGEEIVVCRNPGEARRGGLRRVALRRDVPTVWDGRFELISETDVVVGPLSGRLSRLDAAERASLAALAPAARASLPGIDSGDRKVTCPMLAFGRGVRALELVSGRFGAACGLIAQEGVLARGSDGEGGRGALS